MKKSRNPEEDRHNQDHRSCQAAAPKTEPNCQNVTSLPPVTTLLATMPPAPMSDSERPVTVAVTVRNRVTAVTTTTAVPTITSVPVTLPPAITVMSAAAGTSRASGDSGMGSTINDMSSINDTSTSSILATTSSIHSSVTTSSGGGVLHTLQDPSRYEKHGEIGTGAYGTVYRARDRATDRIVALKKMRFSLTEDGVPMAILREISLLKQLEKFDHPNIVRLLDICHGQRHQREMSLYLVFEHVHQDLATYLENCPSPGLGQDRIKHIIWQILSGVDFLHSHRIVHRDLKPQNLLVTRNGTVKLTDFGLARIYEFYTLLTTVVVTLWYRSPEVLMGLSYATPVDVWSCGCIFAELFLRKALFNGLYEMDQLIKIFEVTGTPSEEEWPENAGVLRSNFGARPARDWSDIVPEMDPDAKDLVKRMLCFSPTRRITANEALMHPYFADYYSDQPSGGSGGDADTSGNSSSLANRSMRSDVSFSSHDDSGGSSMGIAGGGGGGVLLGAALGLAAPQPGPEGSAASVPSPALSQQPQNRPS